MAAAFNVRPPVYLVKELDNTAIFPNEASGRFFCSAFTIGATYDVHGGGGSGGSGGFSPEPFGSYTRYAAPNPPPLTICPKRRLIKKSLVLASLSQREQGISTRNRIQYSVVTQITVTLDPSQGQCCVRGVCEKVKEQVGFEVILLDSKCYPVLTNDESLKTLIVLSFGRAPES